MKEISRLHFGRELIEQARTHDFLVFNADTKSCAIENFGSLYPERNFSFGIAEQNLLAAAAGAALCGEKVFLATFAVFASLRACEQIRTFICLPNLNVTILASHGGLSTGSDGATHISVEDISVMRSLPNMTIVEPSDYIAAERLVLQAISFSGPLYIRFPKAATPRIHDDKYSIIIGKANLICNGKDVSIIVCGWLLSNVLSAAKQLEKQGIYAEIIEMHTIKPIDNEAVICSARKTKAVVTVEDNSIIGGLGGAVAELLSQVYPVPVLRVGILDQFGESGDMESLYQKNKMTVDDIVKRAKEAINLKEIIKK